MCVKPLFGGAGVCKVAVNAFGNPTFQAPLQTRARGRQKASLVLDPCEDAEGERRAGTPASGGERPSKEQLSGEIIACSSKHSATALPASARIAARGRGKRRDVAAKRDQYISAWVKA